MSDEPIAYINHHGTKIWRLKDKFHRIGGPALEYIDGEKQWCVNGQWHRLDGPAIEKFNGTKEWWVNGRRHRVDGPAYERLGGHKEWWVYGKLHRFDGPAIEYANGDKQWWVNGIFLSKEKCMANQAKLRKIQRWWKNHKLQRFVHLTTKNKQFIETFYAPDGQGGVWHKRKMMETIEKMIEA